MLYEVITVSTALDDTEEASAVRGHREGIFREDEEPRPEECLRLPEAEYAALRFHGGGDDLVVTHVV